MGFLVLDDVYTRFQYFLANRFDCWDVASALNIHMVGESGDFLTRGFNW